MIDLSFHHQGIASRNLEQEKHVWISLGYKTESDVFEDEHQGIMGQFLVGAGPRLEILQPLPGHSVLDSYLNKNTKIYHSGYETRDVDHTIDQFRSKRAKLVSPPFPSVAFAGRRIAFLLMPNMYLIELIDAGDRSN
jgi:methylmalonyl-CoA/ethylmalonyl-CoA epimerase